MTDTKLRSLTQMRENLIAKRYSDSQLKELRVEDTDGRMLRLADDDALAAVERRIAALEVESAG